MRIRVQKSHGNLRWVVDYRDGKRKRHQKFFARREDAVTYANTITYNTPKRQQGPSLTLDNVFAGYADGTRARRSASTDKALLYKFRAVLRVLDRMGIVYLTQLDEFTFALLAGGLQAEGFAPHTTQGLLAAYRAALTWGLRRGFLDQERVGEMRIQQPQKTRQKYLTKLEIAALLESLKGHWLRLPVALGIYQGLRRGETCNLTGEDVDPGQNSLTVQRTKNKDWRVIQLHPRLMRYLPTPLPEDSEPLCLDGRGEGVRPDWLTHAFGRYIRNLGWKDVTYHTLRHTCASQMAMSGKHTLYEIGKFLGHRNIKTTQQYTHLLPGQVKPDW